MELDVIIEETATERYGRARPHPDFPVEKVYGFDEIKDEIASRGNLFASYLGTKMSKEQWLEVIVGHDIIFVTSDAFAAERAWYPTNKPKAQELLFKQNFVANMMQYAGFRGIIVRGKKIYSDEAFDWWRKRHNITDLPDEPLLVQNYDFSQLEQEVKKEASFFPDPEPVQAEAPGNIVLSLTTDETAVVVYLDAAHKGKEVTLESKHLKRINSSKSVIEIKRGSESYFVAIFNHIPLVTDEDKNRGNWRKTVTCKIRFCDLEEEHVLFKGNVIVQDWRGWEVSNVK